MQELGQYLLCSFMSSAGRLGGRRREKPVQLDLFLRLTGLVLILKFWSLSFEAFSGEPIGAGLGLAAVICGVLMTVGCRRKLLPAISLIGVAGGYFQIPFSLYHEDFSNHHTQLLIYVLGAVVLTGLSRTENSDLLIRILRFLTLFIYAAAILTKLDPQYLNGARLQQFFMYYYFDSRAFATEFADSFFKWIAWASILAEVIIVLLLTHRFPRVRRIGVIAGSAFHLTLHILLPVQTFSLQMISLLTLFWSENPDKNGK